MKRLIKNRKGTAEVIGTMLFIVILLFFFTNVYLWHDAATKEANQLYLKQINSTFKIEQTNETNNLVVTANGGSDIVLSRLWIVEDTPSGNHLHADLGNAPVAAGTSFTITFFPSPTGQVYADPPQISSINVYYTPGQSVTSITCTVINTLGIVESTTFQPQY